MSDLNELLVVGRRIARGLDRVADAIETRADGVVMLQKVDRLLAGMGQLLLWRAEMTPELARLKDEVAETKQITASAVTLLVGLSSQIRDLKDDPAALAALADDLDASNAELAAAIAANTPAAEPAPEPAPVPEPEPAPVEEPPAENQ